MTAASRRRSWAGSAIARITVATAPAMATVTATPETAGGAAAMSASIGRDVRAIGQRFDQARTLTVGCSCGRLRNPRSASIGRPAVGGKFCRSPGTGPQPM